MISFVAHADRSTDEWLVLDCHSAPNELNWKHLERDLEEDLRADPGRAGTR